MKIGFIGLGRMGYNMVLNLLEHKHNVIAFDLNKKSVKHISKKTKTAKNLEDMIKKLPKQKIIWIMIPAGKPVDSTLKSLISHLKKGDIIIDGGNSFYKDSIKRYNLLKKKGIKFLDCGTSGGIFGARHGACMMIGGDKPVFKKVEMLFKDMCVKNGYGYMGKKGSGHFVKMVHNGIEYGMMAAIAEGIQAVKKYSTKNKTNMNEVVKVYSHGSIIESRLMTWLEKSFNTKGYLTSIRGVVPKGETETEMQHLEKKAPMKALKTARLMRAATRKKASYAGKLIAAMRNQFGGHAVKKK